MTALAEKARLADPVLLARQLLLLKEGAIVTAHLGHTDNPAQDAKAAALQLLDSHIGRCDGADNAPL